MKEDNQEDQSVYPRIVPKVDIYDMEESEDGNCPYCGHLEPGYPYIVDGMSYPYESNHLCFNEAYANCHYGVMYWWNEIHYCEHCKREYYTQHEH